MRLVSAPLPQAGGAGGWARAERAPGLAAEDPRDVALAHPLAPSRLREGERRASTAQPIASNTNFMPVLGLIVRRLIGSGLNPSGTDRR